MSVRTTYRRCIQCGMTIPFNPTAGEFGFFCKSCLKSQVSIPVERLPKVVIPRAPRRKP